MEHAAGSRGVIGVFSRCSDGSYAVWLAGLGPGSCSAGAEGECVPPKPGRNRAFRRLLPHSCRLTNPRPYPSLYRLLPQPAPTTSRIPSLPSPEGARSSSDEFRQSPQSDGGPLCKRARCFQDDTATDTGKERGGFGGKGTAT